MNIDDLMYDRGASAYYGDTLRQALDDQMTLLRTSADTRSIPVDPMIRYRFVGDFYGLLTVLKIPPELHYVVMRMNQINSRTEVPEDMTAILVPDQTAVDRIRQALATSDRLN